MFEHSILFFAGNVCSTNPDGHIKVDKESNGPMILSYEAQCTHILWPVDTKHLVLSRLGESKTLQEVQNQETEKSSRRLRMPEKHHKNNFYMDHYGSNPLETEVYKVYSVYSHPWAQQHMARESADPVHGAMVLMEWQRIFGL